jgi:hypothetical protein
MCPAAAAADDDDQFQWLPDVRYILDLQQYQITILKNV